MKHLILLFSLIIGIAYQIHAMEAVLLLTQGNKSHLMPKKYLECSATLKNMLEESDNRHDLPVPDAIDECFELIAPYFELAYQVKESENKISALRVLQTKLNKHTDQELAAIIDAGNYLDVAVVYKEAAEVLAERLLHSNRITQCLQDGSYNLTSKGHMPFLLAQVMLKKESALANHWLLQEALSSSPQILAGHIATIISICFNHDGIQLASGSDDKTIRLWDPRTGAQMGAPFTGHTGYVISVCFNHDGTLLASGSADKTVRLWDPRTGMQMGAPLAGHTSWVNSVCFNHDGTLLASGSADKTVRLWDPRTGMQMGAPLTGRTSWVNSVCFNHDGTLLASGSVDTTIRLWDPRTGAQMGAPLAGHTGYVISVCFNHDGTLLASGSADKTVRLWDPRTGMQMGAPLTGHTGWVDSACFNHDGTLLASGSDKTIRLWDPRTGMQMGAPLAGHTSWVNSVCFNHDGTLLASGSADKTIRVQRIADKQLRSWFAHGIKPEQVALLIAAQKPNVPHTKICLPNKLQSILNTNA